MIKARELRLGNWVHGHDPASMSYKETGYFKIENIEEDKINVYRVHGFDDEAATAEPIPLTPEILEKAGFEWLKFIHRWNKTGFTIIQSDNGFENGIGDGSFNQPFIKSLHQLQNLYFALTGEELTVNL